jgi:LmbE family N-acetylglucosaminyl deacetylase
VKLALGDSRRPLRNVLCLGSHCDDIEIGCGGTMLKLLSEHRDLTVRWVVFSSNPARAREAQKGASLFLKRAKQALITVKDFRDTFFPYVGGEIKEFFDQLKKDASPDLIFTHFRNDLHQDHRTISDLTWNAFRNHLILEYEIPKWDGDVASPNVFVPLDRSACERKIKYILEAFQTQKEKRWFTPETFLSLMRLRGIESNAPSGLAEGFYGRKLVL